MWIEMHQIEGAHLFVVGPQADDFHGLDFVEHLIDQPMLDIDSSRVGARQVAHQLFKRWRDFVGIDGDDFEQLFRLRFQARPQKFFCIAARLRCINQLPAHQPSSL